jgi:hypothetical protein
MESGKFYTLLKIAIPVDLLACLVGLGRLGLVYLVKNLLYYTYVCFFYLDWVCSSLTLSRRRVMGRGVERRGIFHFL